MAASCWRPALVVCAVGALTALQALAGAYTTAHAQEAAPRVGDRVRIEGSVRADGAFVAHRVSRRSWRTSVFIGGPIERVDRQTRSLTVLGLTVSLANAPEVQSGRPNDLHPGDLVDIEAVSTSSGIQAKRVRLVTDARPGEVQEGVYLEADVQAMDADGFVVLGQRAWLPARNEETQRNRRDDEERLLQPGEVRERLAVAGRADLSVIREQNFSADEERQDTVGRATSSAQIEALLALSDGVEAFGKIKARHRVLARDERNVGASVEVAEAFVSAREIGGSPASVHVGRQRFRDARNWFLDVELDAIRVELTGRRWTADAAIARNVFAGPEPRRRRDQRHVLLSASVEAGASTITGRLIARDDAGVRDEAPVHLGLSAEGRIGRSVRYWSDAALVRGRAGQVAWRGWAADVGGVYRWQARWSPAVLLSVAFGSADDGTNNDVDGTFAPTGLESSRDRMSGTKWISYYGEVFDPHLSNLRILTAAFSVTSPGGISIEGIYHAYSRVSSASPLARNDLRAEAIGPAARVGQEIDAVLRFQHRMIDVALVAGVFVPGPALDAALRPAVLIKPQFRVNF